MHRLRSCGSHSQQLYPGGGSRRAQALEELFMPIELTQPLNAVDLSPQGIGQLGAMG